MSTLSRDIPDHPGLIQLAECEQICDADFVSAGDEFVSSALQPGRLYLVQAVGEGGPLGGHLGVGARGRGVVVAGVAEDRLENRIGFFIMVS